MKKIFNFCFDNWLRPIIFFIATVVLFVFFGSSNNKLIGDITFVLFDFGLLVLLISGIYQLIKGRWIKGILTGVILGGTIFACIFYVIVHFVIDNMEGDKWADNLKIPDNITLNLPKGDGFTVRPDSIINLKRTMPDLEIYMGAQPGMYEFDYWSDKIECGTIYLKAYEITQEYALSSERLHENTSLHLCNTTDSLLRIASKYQFTIYEGDWGKPYAARFEVWFKPDDGSDERKLIEKNYKIEGWMR